MSGYYIQGVRICQDTIYSVSGYVRILYTVCQDMSGYYIQCVRICQDTIYSVSGYVRYHKPGHALLCTYSTIV